VVTDNQFAFGGVTMGAGTSYKVLRVDGLRGQPDVQSNDTPLLEAAGSFAGYDTQPGRTIEMTVVVIGTSAATYETLLAALETAMTPLISTATAFTFKYPTKTANSIDARPRKMSAPTVPTQSKFWGQVELMWFCPDPTIT
jgi:hypothetical protein